MFDMFELLPVIAAGMCCGVMYRNPVLHVCGVLLLYLKSLTCHSGLSSFVYLSK